MMIERFKRVGTVKTTLLKQVRTYTTQQQIVYENEKIINNYFIIKILLDSINKFFH